MMLRVQSSAIIAFTNRANKRTVSAVFTFDRDLNILGKPRQAGMLDDRQLLAGTRTQVILEAVPGYAL
jgi:hypothetical protein